MSDLAPARTPEPLEYQRLLRAGRPGAWRPLVGVVALVALVLLAQVVVVSVLSVYLLLTGVDGAEASRRLSGADEVTPVFLAVVNLGWAAAIPATWLVLWSVHRLRPGWLASVRPRIRWRWFATCLGLALLALVATLVVSAVLPAQGESTQVSGQVNDFSRTTRDFLLVIVLLTPLQAAGEEYAFRGYLTQVCGGLVRQRWVAVVVPALLFALAHGLGQDLPIFFDRFAFGLVAGALVVLTGGLEAGIAMHVLNNFFAYGLALAFGDMTSALNPTGGSWWSIPVTLTQSLVFLALTLAAARRQGVERVSARLDLVGSRRPV
ncbi:CPBP family intramembrane glutamic endopeptidase [Nocardioides sp. Leaf285]|uniref:CPBP family intramembrane glutamic endopeptidase n=1 Tax=Nocardioides sp. Leaf285 TaxID=1736322 RepID=UPI0007034839|nr:CPBP family intramembrane glutamic endopeptidase [Nocardioides sp. Leaf285]KQP66576.1 abortive infection protein [Nocardioides sp. Leaf285]